MLYQRLHYREADTPIGAAPAGAEEEIKNAVGVFQGNTDPCIRNQNSNVLRTKLRADPDLLVGSRRRDSIIDYVYQELDHIDGRGTNVWSTWSQLQAALSACSELRQIDGLLDTVVYIHQIHWPIGFGESQEQITHNEL